MSTLLELADRCEAAMGPDRELDFWIYVRLNPGKDSDEAIQQDIDLVGIDGMYIPHAYTASIDAAMTLVPTEIVPNIRRGTWWCQVETLGPTAHVAYENGDSGIIEESGKADTPSLALCAAALRARAALTARELK